MPGLDLSTPGFKRVQVGDEPDRQEDKLAALVATRVQMQIVKIRPGEIGRHI